jgi:OOP family OmpA-OmpF porin
MPEGVAERKGPPDDSFAELRSIIVGPERQELLALQAHLLDPTVQTRDVSRVLPDALQLRARDPQLMRALAPSIEDAITASVRRDPQPLADALFPVIGPAIRKAVAHTFDAMLESVNQTIERSVSWHALQWRWTAWRTGRPFAEVVLLNTLEYRVEQVFLIHRTTGLLLQHVSTSQRSAENADQISAMLTAITDFARDSFQVERADTIESMRIGDLAVSISQGPQAVLAAVVRGAIPLTARTAFENALESVHRQFGPALQDFHGDASAFEATRPILEPCLLTQRRSARRRPSYRGWAMAAAALVLLLGAWLYLEVREQQRWNAYLSRLRAEPGIVVLSSDRRGGRFFVSGLLDPLAATARDRLVSTSGLNNESIESRWEPYQAIHPPFVTARAGLLLRPPAGVALAFTNGLLTATGSAPERWIADSERLAPAIAGVQRFVFAGQSAEARLIAEIERASISFAKGLAAVDSAQQQALAAAVQRLAELDAVLTTSGRRARLDILGHADSDGPDALNTPLSQARADTVLAAIQHTPLTHIAVSARGLGRAPVTPGATELDHERNRRVAFRVHLADLHSAQGDRP